MEVGVRLAVQVSGCGGCVRVAGPQEVGVSGGRVAAVEAALAASAGPAPLHLATAGPQLAWLLHGADTSLVALGRAKTRALLAPDPDRLYDEEARGIIPRFLADMFRELAAMPERSYAVHITWMRVIDGSVADLLGCGLTKCDSLAEALRHLHRGFGNRRDELCHTVFTVSIEQKWVGAEGMLHHRLSTASFCELSSRPEPGLRALEDVVRSLAEGADGKSVDYERSLLTAMLRDSFGGRAFTWIVCCLDADRCDEAEELRDLEFCLLCRNVRNFVTVNGYADNDTPLDVEKEPGGDADRRFGLRFAAEQWIKLVSNAEGLFRKILRGSALSEGEEAQINEWLFLKAECDECLDPVSLGGDEGEDARESDVEKSALPRITEDTEPSEPDDSDDSDGDSDSSVRRDDFLFADELRERMELFREKTDELMSDRCEEFFPCGGGAVDFETSDPSPSESSARPGRRKTVRPGESLTDDELASLRRTAETAMSPESRRIVSASRKAREDPEPKLVERQLLKIVDPPAPTESCKKYKALHQKYSLKRDLISKLTETVRDGESRLRDLVGLCVAEDQLLRDLSELLDRRTEGAGQFDSRDRTKRKENDETGPGGVKFKNRRSKFLVNAYNRRAPTQKWSEQIDQDNNREIKKRENKLKLYKKQIEQIKKQIKRDEKRKNTLELELIKDKSRLDELRDRESNGALDVKVKNKVQNSLKQVSVRISHLDHVLKEKTSDLQTRQLSEDKESMLRREIRNLRKTRECLIDQRCVLGRKRKTQRSLSDDEERKLLEYEEAIEAIDTAIEFKNELICGRGNSSIDSDERRERGEELLMARLNKLSVNEMRTLLYKYFQKVIDLRTTCAGLEAAAGAAQREAGGWRKRCGDAWAALQHARLTHARRTTTLTARHYHALNQLMNGMNGENESDSSMCDINGGRPLPLEFPTRIDRQIIESDIDNIMTQHRIASTTTKFKVKENVVEGNARILDRIQNFTKFHQSGIPSQNLKQLQITNSNPTTKVTRQKNKLVIVQEDKLNK